MTKPGENTAENIPKPRLIVGLGNPGREYENTRHNIGFMVVDALASQHHATWTREKRWDCMVAKIADSLLIKPLTYMNLSGKAVSAAARFHKITPQEVLTIYDDVNLPLGRLRLRPSGSAGGHNGMRSLIAHLGGESFPRLRIGIGYHQGRPDGRILADHVLGRFEEVEQPFVQEAIQRSLDAIQTIFTRGFEAAMNLFNQPPSPPPSA